MKRPRLYRPQPDLTSKRLLNPGESIQSRIMDIIEREVDEFPVDTEERLAHLDAFRSVLCAPRKVVVECLSGVKQPCWRILGEGGQVNIVYLPYRGEFSLCTYGEDGLVETGMRGSALGCFSSL